MIVLEFLGPGGLAAAASGLLALATVGIRVWCRVALARQQRRSMTAAVNSLATADTLIRVGQRVGDDAWFLEFDPLHRSDGRLSRIDCPRGGGRER